MNVSRDYISTPFETTPRPDPHDRKFLPQQQERGELRRIFQLSPVDKGRGLPPGRRKKLIGP